jgi:hypothetical protein
MEHPLDAARALLPGTELSGFELISDGERSTVHRVRARSGGDERSLVVKQFHTAGESWVRECSALAALRGTGPAPELLAESPQPQLAILADLGGGPSLADALLRGTAEDAENALVLWARTLAEAHAAGRGRRPKFEAELALRSGDLPGTAPSMRNVIEDAVRVLDRDCATLGVVVPSGALEDLRELSERLSARSELASLTPGDTCPDNCVRAAADRLVLIDFEDAQWRHVAWDVACLLVPWPTCWCSWRMPDSAAGAAVAAYREVAAGAFSDVGRPGFEADLQCAVAGWALIATAALLDRAMGGGEPNLGPAKPTPPRRATVLHRLEQAARIDAVPSLAELSDRLAVELRGRWGADLRLPLAPAFRSS